MRTLSITLAGALFLGGCVFKPPEFPAELAKSELVTLPEQWDHEALPDAVVDGWVARFKDTRLAELVALAQANNPDLRVAYANIQRAEALLRQTAAGLLPSANTQSSYSESDGFEGDAQNTAQFFISLSYLLDVWGSTRASINAARADLDAFWLNYQFAQLSLAGAVAKAYFLTIESDSQIAIDEANVASLVKISEIAELQYREGAVTQQDVNIAMSDVASAKSRLLASEQAARNARRILNLILGAYPDDQISVAATLPHRAELPAAGVPAALLERRPDLVAAERSVAAAFNRVYVAEVARYPRITLSGSVGGIAMDFDQLFRSDRLTWSVGPSVGLPLYQGGAITAQIDSANAVQQASIASYASLALTALSDVEIALDANATLAAQQEQIEISYATAKDANRVAQLRYENGDISLVDLIEVQRREFSRESELLQNQRRQLDARVDLFLALGGDWEQATP